MLLPALVEARERLADAEDLLVVRELERGRGAPADVARAAHEGERRVRLERRADRLRRLRAREQLARARRRARRAMGCAMMRNSPNALVYVHDAVADSRCATSGRVGTGPASMSDRLAAASSRRQIARAEAQPQRARADEARSRTAAPDRGRTRCRETRWPGRASSRRPSC